MNSTSRRFRAMHKIFLTGSSGLLGGQILSVVKEKLDYTVNTKSYSELSSLSISALASELSECSLVIHCAANTNVELCELNKRKCFADNAYFTKKLVLAAKQQKTIPYFIYISSTGVYGNQITDRPFVEADLACPTTAHHKSKLRGEHHVASLPEHLIVRTGWLFGAVKGKPDFVSRIQESARLGGRTMKANVDQVGVPTYAPDVAERLLSLIENCENGIVNVVSGGVASRYQYVSAIIKQSKLSVSVEPGSSKDFPRVAPVSTNESAKSARPLRGRYNQLRHWTDALTCHIETLAAP